VLDVAHDDQTLREQLDERRDLALRTSFHNERGDEMRVYQVQPYGLISPGESRR
jgi:hypothetical protein